MLTALVSPIVFAVDRVTASKGEKLRQAVLDLEVEVASHELGNEVKTKKQTIRSYLQEKDMILENLVTDVNIFPDSKELRLDFRVQEVGASSSIGCSGCGYDHAGFFYKALFTDIQPEIEQGIPGNNDNLPEAILPLRELDVGGINAKLEKNKMFRTH